jgi:hypothetical protein
MFQKSVNDVSGKISTIPVNNILVGKTCVKKKIVEPTEITVKQPGKFDDFLTFLSNAFTPTAAYAQTSKLNIPELDEQGLTNAFQNNNGRCVYYFYASDIVNKNLIQSGDDTMGAIINVIGENVSYYKIDVAKLSNESQQEVNRLLGEGRGYPAFLFVRNINGTAETVGMRGAAADNSPRVSARDRNINKISQWFNK